MVSRTPILLAIAALLLAVPVVAQAETARGTSHADVFAGTPAGDEYWGYRGNDVLRGNAGDDNLMPHDSGECVDRSLDEARALVSGHDSHALG